MLHEKSFDELLTFTLYLKNCGNFSTVDVVKATAVNFLTNIRGKAFEDPFASMKFLGVLTYCICFMRWGDAG